MSGYQLLIIGVYSTAALILANRNAKRELSWIVVAAGVYLATSSYWRIGLPEPAFVSGIVDGAACVAIYLFGKYRWELLIWRFFQFFILVNIVRLMGQHGMVPVAPSAVYSTLLEIANILIALTAIGTGFLQRGPVDDDRSVWIGRRFHHFMHSLCSERPHPPFWKVPG